MNSSVKGVVAKVVKKAAAAIKRGDLVIFPTETVYGLGADAFNAKAVAKIFVAKSRPSHNPLIVHIADRGDLDQLIQGEVSAVAKRLMAKFWPGPLSLVFLKCGNVPSVVSGGSDTVAVRLPDHELAREFIRQSGTPIAAPSANPSNYISPTTPEHLKLSGIASKAEVVIEAGATLRGLESTVVDVTTNPPRLLRQGSITIEDLREVVPQIDFETSPKNKLKPAELKSPGNLAKHYSPKSKLVLMPASEQNSNLDLNLLVTALEDVADQKKIAIVASTELIRKLVQKLPEANYLDLGSRSRLELVGKNLYRELIAADQLQPELIAAELMPETALGRTINDRLKRAAAD